ncbi:MAG: hypothetical protein JW932_18460 [Deltaproteobacteria bacterium]|nr:hypothetical protein [Deltaproteobacteria bacterium]
MESSNKKELLQVIDNSTQHLHEQIDMHRHLVNSILNQRVSEGTLKDITLPFHSKADENLKQAIQEAIEVLEESRKAFKSKRLETLRKKLTDVLIESR